MIDPGNAIYLADMAAFGGSPLFFCWQEKRGRAILARACIFEGINLCPLQ
jgi:hypothetical protein